MFRWTKRFALLAVLIVAALLTGCGQTQTVTHTSAPARTVAQFVCHHKMPAQAGECVEQELEARSISPAAPRLSATFGGAAHEQCIDISRWQPHPEFGVLYREGIRCVIVQGADNDHQSNPFFASQVHGAHETHMQVGVYIYVEGASSSSQGNALVAAARPLMSLITAGAWIDNEQSDAYAHACGIAAVLRAHFHTVGDYGSPGNIPSWLNSCGLLYWPAEWGGGAPYPAPGFSYSSIVFRQWCGTCVLVGNSGQIDRDEDRGLLALAKPAPKPRTRSQLRAQLRREKARRLKERAFLTRHHCRQPPWHVAVGLSGHPNGRYEHSCHVELRHGRTTNRIIRDLQAKGA